MLVEMFAGRALGFQKLGRVIFMYVDDVLNRALKRNHTQPEFCQAVTEVLESIRPVVESNPYYEKTSLLERSSRSAPRFSVFAGWTTTTRCRSTGATVFSSIVQSAHIKAVCGFILPLI